MLTAEDRLSIFDVVTRADDCATRRDAVGYVALFTDDAIMDGEEGNYKGNSNIERAVREVWHQEHAGTHHVTTGISIEEDRQNGVIIVLSTLLMMTRVPLALTGIANVRQELTRVETGWKIRRRSIR